MGLPAMLACLQAAHGAISACVQSGLLPLTAIDRAACQRMFEQLVTDWVQSGRLSYDDHRHARALTTAPLSSTPHVFSRLWTPGLARLPRTNRTRRWIPINSKPLWSDPQSASEESDSEDDNIDDHDDKQRKFSRPTSLIAWISGSTNHASQWVKIAQAPSLPLRAKM